MSLQLYFGPAGSGKSTTLQKLLTVEAAKNPKKNYILIVPDQFTMQTQMDIVKLSPNGGILNIDVLSFSRLCYRVFSESGAPHEIVLDDTGKSLVLRHVAESVSKDMPYIGKNLNRVGYINEVKSTISEFMQYGVSVQDVEKLAAGDEKGLLSVKLKDLAVIYKAFMEYNNSKYITGEESLDFLCRSLESADFIKDAVVVFDGFTGFTPIQERVILRLLELTEKVIVSFTLGSMQDLAESEAEKTGKEKGEEKLFYLSKRSAARLKAMALDKKIPIDEDVFIENTEAGRFGGNPELKHLEKNLFRYPAKSFEGIPQNIALFKCTTIDEEVSEIALRIRQLIETGEYAYRDIAVVTGNQEAYASAFETRMNELDMPCFIDRTNSISLNPFTEYIKSALQIIIKDYSYDSVFHYLKSGFTDFTDEETDRFDKYVTSINFRGSKAYHKPLTKRQKGRAKEKFESEKAFHENFRQRLVSGLEVLERPAKTAKEYVTNLYDFILANDSYNKLSNYAKAFEEANDLAKAKEYSQIYRLIMELLDTIYTIVGDEEMDISEFYKILEAGILEIKVGTIPKNVDRIVIGDIERTRLCEVKALFFAGVNDGNIPKSGNRGGLLSDMDRENLTGSNDISLAPTLREEMYTQKLYLYMNMLKPSEKLFISYAAKDAEGKGLTKSYLIDVIKQLYPALKEEKITERASAERIVTRKDSLRFFSKLMRQYVQNELSEGEKLLAAALLNIYRQDDTFDFSETIRETAFIEYQAKPLAEAIVKALYGETISASISAMEQYANCAYRFFLSCGLKLKEEENYDFTARDLGTVYHGILDSFMAILEKNNLVWADLSDEDMKKLVEEAVADYCENYEQGILLEDEQSLYLRTRIVSMMERTLKTLKYQLCNGNFRPSEHEMHFEREIKVQGGTMRLNGKVDRVDLCKMDDRLYVKIMDFKTGERVLDISDIYHGLSQQLCVYMSEVLKLERGLHPELTVLPSSMFYYHIDNPMISFDAEKSETITPENIEKELLKELKLEGLFEASSENEAMLDKNGTGLVLNKGKGGSKSLSTEEMQGMLRYVDRLVVSIGEGVLSGKKTIAPMVKKGKGSTNACDICAYKGICRFDEAIPGFKARSNDDISKEEARQKVVGGGDDGLYIFN